LTRLSENFRPTSINLLNQAITNQQTFFNLFQNLTDSAKSLYSECGYHRHTSRYDTELERFYLLFQPYEPHISNLLDYAWYYASKGWIYLAMELLLTILLNVQRISYWNVSLTDHIITIWDMSVSRILSREDLLMIKRILDHLPPLTSRLLLSGNQLFECIPAIDELGPNHSYVSLFLRTFIPSVRIFLV
jgi:hypothetical protein